MSEEEREQLKRELEEIKTAIRDIKAGTGQLAEYFRELVKEAAIDFREDLAALANRFK
jgi:hypothetical protein